MTFTRKQVTYNGDRQLNQTGLD